MSLIAKKALRRRVEFCAEAAGFPKRRASRKFLTALYQEIDEAAEQIIFRYLAERTGKNVLLAHGEVWKEKKPKLITPALLAFVAMLLAFQSLCQPKLPPNAPAPVYGLMSPLPAALAADRMWSEHSYTNAGTNVPVVRASVVLRGSNDVVTLAWTASTDANAVGSGLFLSTNLTNWTYTDTGTNTDWTFSNLIGGTRYFAEVAAYDGADNFSSNSAAVDYLARHAIQVLVSNQVSWLDECSISNRVHWFSNGPSTVMVRFVNYPGALLQGSADLQTWKGVGEWSSGFSNAWLCVTDAVLPNKFYRIP